VFASIFFLRTVLQVFNCETDIATGKSYLKADPTVECQTYDNSQSYISMYVCGWIGIVEYSIMFGLVAYGLTVQKDMFGFLGDKFEDEFYFWEIVLVSRKVLLMMSFMFFSSKVEQAWFCGSMVIITALVMHAFARPFEDDLIDVCELLSLVSLLFIQQSAVVFRIVDDPVDPDESNGGRLLSTLLKWMSFVLIAMNCVLAIVVEVRVYQHVQDSEEDYKVKMTKKKIATLHEQLEVLEETLETAEQDAEAFRRRMERLDRLKATAKNGGSLSTDAFLRTLSSQWSLSMDGEDPATSEDPTASMEVEQGGQHSQRRKKDPHETTFANPLTGCDGEGGAENPLSSDMQEDIPSTE